MYAISSRDVGATPVDVIGVQYDDGHIERHVLVYEADDLTAEQARELGATDVRGKFTVKTVPQRLKRQRKDPWSEYAKTRQSIAGKMRRALGGG